MAPYTQDGLYEMQFRTVNEPTEEQPGGSGGVRFDGNKSFARWEAGTLEVYSADPRRTEPNLVELTAREANASFGPGQLKLIEARDIDLDTRFDAKEKEQSVKERVRAAREEDGDDADLSPEQLFAAFTQGTTLETIADELNSTPHDEALPFASYLTEKLMAKQAAKFVALLEDEDILADLDEQETARKPTRKSVAEAITNRVEELSE